MLQSDVMFCHQLNYLINKFISVEVQYNHDNILHLTVLVGKHLVSYHLQHVDFSMCYRSKLEMLHLPVILSS